MDNMEDDIFVLDIKQKHFSSPEQAAKYLDKIAYDIRCHYDSGNENTWSLTEFAPKVKK